MLAGGSGGPLRGGVNWWGSGWFWVVPVWFTSGVKVNRIVQNRLFSPVHKKRIFSKLLHYNGGV